MRTARIATAAMTAMAMPAFAPGEREFVEFVQEKEPLKTSLLSLSSEGERVLQFRDPEEVICVAPWTVSRLGKDILLAVSMGMATTYLIFMNIYICISRGTWIGDGEDERVKRPIEI